VEQNKISLSAHDDKRFILPNKIDTFPHGHILIPFIMSDQMESTSEPAILDHIQLEAEEEPMDISSDDEMGSDVEEE
jgi:hypothetical protein